MSLFFFQLGNELKKLFARKRTYIVFGVFMLMEALVLFLLNRPHPKAHLRRIIEQNGYGFEHYFSGLTLALMIVMWTVILLGGLYLALVSGDMVAKEVEEGTMRMSLCRPVSRLRLGLIKYIACVIYTFVLMAFIGVTALIAGLCYRGWGGLFVFAPMEHVFALFDAGPGLQRCGLAFPLAALSLTTVSSLGFMLSCFNMKPSAATIVTLSVLFLDTIFRNIPYFESLHGWFITTHMSSWLHCFEPYIPWWRICGDYAYLIGLDATCVLIGLAVFEKRDFKA